MPKTETQAQKRAEREQRNKEKRQAYEKEKAARAVEFQKMQESKGETLVEEKALTKQEQRKRKKALKKQTMLEEPGIILSAEMPKLQIDKSSVSFDTAAILTALEKVENEEKLKKETAGRLVENHSSYCPGLKPVLIRLSKLLPSSCTIIPGAISNGKNHYEEFDLRRQRQKGQGIEEPHTYKFVARKGYTKQNVSISVENPEIYTEDLICEKIEAVKSNKLSNENVLLEDKDLNYSLYNQTMSSERTSAWKANHQKQHIETTVREKNAKRENQMIEYSRKLANKDIPSEQVEQYAKRDVEIISGEKRGKYSMRKK